MESTNFTINPSKPTHSLQTTRNIGGFVSAIFENTVPFMADVSIGRSKNELVALERRRSEDVASGKESDDFDFYKKSKGLLKNIQRWSFLRKDAKGLIDSDYKINLLNDTFKNTEDASIEREIKEEMNDSGNPDGIEKNIDYEDELTKIIVSSEDDNGDESIFSADNSSGYSTFMGRSSNMFNTNSDLPANSNNSISPKTSSSKEIERRVYNNVGLSKKIESMSNKDIDIMLKDIHDHVSIRGSTRSAVERVKTSIMLRSSVLNSLETINMSGREGNISRKKARQLIQSNLDNGNMYSTGRKEAYKAIESLKFAEHKYREEMRKSGV
ncbi:MAG: hypothetical protein KAH32_07375 [Chlamydiia bacterium]|nr:hypothetical protein [Chlamydiia bacterium]